MCSYAPEGKNQTQNLHCKQITHCFIPTELVTLTPIDATCIKAIKKGGTVLHFVRVVNERKSTKCKKVHA